MRKTNMELIYQIAKETDLSIRYSEKNSALVFTYQLDGEEASQIVRKSDRADHNADQDKLLGYVLEEIYSTLLGAKEEKSNK